jgi:hypothetical protein
MTPKIDTLKKPSARDSERIRVAETNFSSRLRAAHGEGMFRSF